MITNSMNPAKKKKKLLQTENCTSQNVELLKHDLKIHCKAPRVHSVVFKKLNTFYPESQTNPINI